MPHRQGLLSILEKVFGKDRDIYGIEIGCFKGDLSKSLLNGFPNLYLTTIDPYIQWKDVIENTHYWQNRFQILPVSSNIGYKLLDRKFDFVFIDGDHSYEQCKKDIENYLPMTKTLISGHNYHKFPCKENGFDGGSGAHPGVHLSVDEIFGDKVKLAPDFIWYVQI